ncbi:MAG: GNAT family N-acetyltransferase [Rhizobiaceae bacterium]
MNVITSSSEFTPTEMRRDLKVELVSDITLLKDEWMSLQKQKTCFIYQNYDWVRIAFETFDAKHRPVMIVGRAKGVLQFIIPLVLVSGMPSKLRWPGGSHTNVGCGLYSREFLSGPGTNTMRAVFEEIQNELPGVVLLHLKNQPMEIAGFHNPMLELPHQTNPNPFYLMDLTPGLDAILDLGSGKRKRKLFRRQVRMAKQMGGHELVVPKKPGDIRAIMTEFFKLKAERFAELGIQDVFSDKATQEFLLRLAEEPEKDGIQLLRLFVLKVGGKMRAMYGSGILQDYCQSCINAVSYDEFSEESPGEMVMYLMVDHLINKEFSTLDLGIGQERYKESWCKETNELKDTIFPLSYSAIPFSQLLRSETRLKQFVKSNSMMWEQFKKLRKLKGRI